MGQHRCRGLHPGCPRRASKKHGGSGTALICIQLLVKPVLESRLDLHRDAHRNLALALFVARVALADDHDVAVATNHAALLTDRLDAGVDLHLFLFSLSSRHPEGWALLLSNSRN